MLSASLNKTFLPFHHTGDGGVGILGRVGNLGIPGNPGGDGGVGIQGGRNASFPANDIATTNNYSTALFI